MVDANDAGPPVTVPKISVVTVVFNGARDIARTIESTLSQDHPNTEYVVVDGQSNDGTQAIVARFGSAIDVYVSEPDEGIYDAMNKGIALASGEFVLFMNCGDTFASSSALSSIANKAHPVSEQVIFGCWERQDARGRCTHCRPAPAAGFFNHQSILYSRSLHRRYGLYVDVRGLTTADYLFFMTLVVGNSVRYTTVDTTVAVIDIGGVSAGPQTLSQKFAIDFLLGRASRKKLLMVLACHPMYRRAKAFLGWIR